ncbi:hypothetical protein [Microcystis panniformis]|uniref:Uncharacterized protein n=1 Tax=Microcystis panniformis FACHB-1757 TaxID=1638788 RepID=A0A0K1RZI3_9CHRO|nr:hypothetical protein [Microcystis panniformis]AKV67215.1 hypothetical protein VL20_2098 [Microcystis panniformis FACHB-1757]
MKGVTIAVITRPKYVSLIDQLSVISYQLSVISYQLLKARGKRKNLAILLPKKKVIN